MASRLFPWSRPWLLIALVVLGSTPLWGCGETVSPGGTGKARAVRITQKEELIGGPAARGKIGDYLIENDHVRFIVAGKGQAWQGGVFGGSLIDADVTRWWPEFQYGKGQDAFGETFPLVNLVVANPEMAGNALGIGEEGLNLVAIPSGIEVLSDGSDGQATIRVTGRAGYMFETMKFLNKDFLLSFITEPFEIMGFKLPIDQLLNMFLKVNVYSLVNRLQLDFLFYNDYILGPEDHFLTLRTTIITSPPSEKRMELCSPILDCDLDCENGYSLQEQDYTITGQTTPTPGKVMCPVCKCAEPPEEMLSLNESEDIFQIMLGDLEPWRNPAWKGGLLGGDFLFFGGEANIFTPGLGFDENRKIFENMWQGVPTLANPLTFDWITAVADNVSYGWVTVNHQKREGASCPTYRLALTRLAYEDEQEVIDILVNQLGFDADLAQARVRHVIVDQRPFPLMEFDTPTLGTDTWLNSPEELPLATIPDAENPEETVDMPAKDIFPDGVQLSLIAATECQSSKVLIPIFSTSATAVMSHKSRSSLDLVNDIPVDSRRVYTFERYFVLGDGDVGAVLDTIYDIKGLAKGRVQGAVLDEGTQAPVHHASVFALLDPRTEPSEPAPATYDQLVAANRARFGHDGFVSQMQSDRGLDLVHDGDFDGPLVPGPYFLVAFDAHRGASSPVPVEITAGETATAYLLIPGEGTIKYMVRNESGALSPARLMFVPLDESGEEFRWEGKNYVEMGGSRYDHGILTQVHSHTGEGSVDLPAGQYNIYVSRGFEYSIDKHEGVQVEAGQTVTLESVLVHEVDTSGYISGDFHLHARPSIDAALPLRTRVAANVAEGIEFVASTDHDYLVDYAPYINEMGLNHLLKSTVGVETTTLEFGHYIGFPMEYDHNDLPVHNTPPWYGKSLADVWQAMRDRVQEGVAPEDFVVQVNHARDGFMGYLSQIGITGYDMERSTPGMEMCNPQTEEIPCNFDSIELMNEKRFELLRTPTIGEMNMHNSCFEELMKTTSVPAFGATGEDALCANLRQPPNDNCGTIADEIAASTATNLELAELYAIKDHCQWHEEFAELIARCTPEMGLVACKRQALDALKLLTVRYMMERTPQEQEAYYATTPETDLGCDFEKSLVGTTPNLDDEGLAIAGCGGEDCACEPCVCSLRPKCCLEPGHDDDGNYGTGWDEECASLCLNECLGGPQRPCTSKQQIFDDWFVFLNHGFNKTAVGNSDSHDTKAEAGLPRNYIPVSDDRPDNVDPREIYRAIHEHRVVVSTGPFIHFTIEDATVGDTLVEPVGDQLKAHVKVQTASWFGIDRVEIYRNGHLEMIRRVEPAVEDTVDFNAMIHLPRPDEDSWYVVLAYGLDSRFLMSPIYKRIPLGKMLIPTIISLGAQSILISFQSVLKEVEKSLGSLLGEDGLEGALGGLFGLSEMPDSFPMFPLVLTNPIWVDVDGGGWKPPLFAPEQQLPDGSWPLPSFCSRPCTVVQAMDEAGQPLVDDAGNPVWDRSDCGLNQLCVPDSLGSDAGTCKIPIPANCVGSQIAAQ
jgi:hypothetical protein